MKACCQHAAWHWSTPASMLPALQVKELELGTDMKSVVNLLDFLEKVFNGGSDFNEPIRRCLTRLSDAKWANSDILLVSDGELRQPGQVGTRSSWSSTQQAVRPLGAKPPLPHAGCTHGAEQHSHPDASAQGLLLGQRATASACRSQADLPKGCSSCRQPGPCLAGERPCNTADAA